MKTFNAPAIDVEKLAIMDVIATSACDGDCNTYEADPDNVCPLD